MLVSYSSAFFQYPAPRYSTLFDGILLPGVSAAKPFANVGPSPTRTIAQPRRPQEAAAVGLALVRSADMSQVYRCRSLRVRFGVPAAFDPVRCSFLNCAPKPFSGSRRRDGNPLPLTGASQLSVADLSVLRQAVTFTVEFEVKVEELHVHALTPSRPSPPPEPNSPLRTTGTMIIDELLDEYVGKSFSRYTFGCSAGFGTEHQRPSPPAVWPAVARLVR